MIKSGETEERRGGGDEICGLTESLKLLVNRFCGKPRLWVRYPSVLQIVFHLGLHAPHSVARSQVIRAALLAPHRLQSSLPSACVLSA